MPTIAAGTSIITSSCMRTDDEMLRGLQQADVLLLGNSRLMFALRGTALRQYCLTRGLRPFALGFGHHEQHRLASEDRCGDTTSTRRS